MKSEPKCGIKDWNPAPGSGSGPHIRGKHYQAKMFILETFLPWDDLALLDFKIVSTCRWFNQRCFAAHTPFIRLEIFFEHLQMVGKDVLQYSLWGGAALGLAVEWNNIRSHLYRVFF